MRIPLLLILFLTQHAIATENTGQNPPEAQDGPSTPPTQKISLPLSGSPKKIPEMIDVYFTNHNAPRFIVNGHEIQIPTHAPQPQTQQQPMAPLPPQSLVTPPPMQSSLLLQPNVPRLLDICKLWAHEHWIKITLGSLATLYGATMLGLSYATHRIESANSWACWHEEIPLTHLRSLPTETVTHELFNAIIADYAEPSTVLAITRFINDTNAEIVTVQRYLTFCSWLEYAHVIGIFPVQSATKRYAYDKLERLIFLQTIITSSPLTLTFQP